MYNGVLTLKLPRGVMIMGFADHILLSMSGETLEEIEMLATETIINNKSATVQDCSLEALQND